MTSSLLPTSPPSSPSEVTVSAPPRFNHLLWLPNNPPPPAIIPPFDTEEQIRSRRLAYRLGFSVLAINIVSVFLSGFDGEWELPKWAISSIPVFYAPAVVSYLQKKQREGRRKIQARDALDQELGAVVDEEEKRAGL